ncbi:MAG TPA: CopD family protein [Gemmatimonadales bacterium]
MDEPLVDAAALARWLGYAALFATAGAVSFRLVLRRAHLADPAPLARRAAAIGAVAAIILVVTHLLRLYYQLADFADPEEGITSSVAGLVLGSTAWGKGWHWQMGAALLALAGLAAARKSDAGWTLGGLGALGSIVTASLTGHAIEHPWGIAGTALQVTHLGAGSVWLGTLLLLVSVAYPVTRSRGGEREEIVAALVNAYSPVALTAGLVAIGLGLLLGWQYTGGVEAIIGTTYGRALLVKAALLGAVALIGAWNWRRVRPALGAAPGSARLFRSAAAELTFGTLLLAVTAVLVALPAPAL